MRVSAPSLFEACWVCWDCEWKGTPEVLLGEIPRKGLDRYKPGFPAGRLIRGSFAKTN